MLSAAKEPVLAAAARQAGANGYCLKTASVPLLETVIRQVAAGESRWLVAAAPRSVGIAVQPSCRNRSPCQWVCSATTPNAAIGGATNRSAIAEVTDQLRTLELSLLDQAVLAGRRRELITARWLVNRLLATPALADDATASIAPPTPPVASPLAIAGNQGNFPPPHLVAWFDRR
ncbi:MAG: hypothetical protein HC881_01495 [Leptolyngbyaceae cyanobacterium SL_7_1]|nr:hypothetical protein [Leptolyngbyaceae cyanobacterium SL_7_1]